MSLRRCRPNPAAVLALAAGLLAAAGPQGAAAQVERYRYEAVPLGEAAEARRERIAVEIATEGQEVRYRSRALSADNTVEVTEILTGRGGAFFSAERTVTPAAGAPRRNARIRREGDQVLVNAFPRAAEPAERHRVPEGSEVAVDASLFLLLRSFPFAEPRELRVFMADFSGSTVTVTVRAAGAETITTPAGTFACHRIEVIVHVPLLPSAWRPRIVQWLAQAQPHFLVKHRGKRGPFTAAYETVLTAVGEEGGGR